MAPPNFSHHKKRKSRSRGASARRVSRNKSRTCNSIDQSQPHRSTSYDQTSTQAGQPSTSKNTSANLSHPSVRESEPLNSITLNSQHKSKCNFLLKASLPSNEDCTSAAKSKKLSSSTSNSSSIHYLADSVAAAAIVTAGSALRNSQESSFPSKSMEDNASPLLSNLCILLDRLYLEYGSTSSFTTKEASSPEKNKLIKSQFVTNIVKKSNSELPMKKDNNKGSPKNKICMDSLKNDKLKDSPKNDICKDLLKNDILKESPKKDSVKKDICENLPQKEICNGEINEDNLTQEQKKELRKLKKEEKKNLKLVKPEKSSVKTYLSNQIPSDTVNLEAAAKSKADLKRERREKQEAQRAAKVQLNEKEKVEKTSVQMATVDVGILQLKKKTPCRKKDISSTSKRLPLLGHLTQQIEEVDPNLIHPAIRIAGLSMKDHVVDGCNARVLATLSAISALIEDYSTPPSCDLSRDLSDNLAPNIVYLHSCRPIPEPMNNAIRFVKREINNVDLTVPELQAKQELLYSFKNYIDQNIILASKTICQKASKIIENGDVILTFGFSSLVLDTVKEAAVKSKNISLIIVDKPVPASGVNMLPALSELGIKLYYRIIPDITSIMSNVTKVIIEAEGVVLNGAVMGICGTAGLALEASIRSIPFIVLSHTYKFCNIDLTDSLVVNELGNSEDIMNNSLAKYNRIFSDWKEHQPLNVVNLVYDVTPAEMVSVLVTERHIVPTTVVPTIIKKNFADILGHD